MNHSLWELCVLPSIFRRAAVFRSVRGLQAFGLSLLLAFPSAVFAQEPEPAGPAATEQRAEKKKTPIEDMSLEELMKLEVEEVFTASKWVQSVTEAPAAVSIITSDEIRRHGYRTLAEILQSVRSFFVTYDRNYSYLGIRGFVRAGDYNSRVLLLIDGQRTNENVYNSSYFGTEFAVDVDLIDRVEIIRGPSSSIYGTNAFFAVVNVITKRGRNLKGFEFSTELASLNTYRTRASYGDEFRNGLDVVLSASFYHSKGQRRLYFEEFDAPETNGGIAEDADGEHSAQVLAGIRFKDLSLRVVENERKKLIPTASFESLFNDRRSQTIDRYGSANLQYNHLFASGLELTAKFSHNHYYYDGDYAYAGDAGATFIGKDLGKGRWWESEFQVTKALPKRHKFTAGFEHRYNSKQDQIYYADEPFLLYTNYRGRSHNWGAYAQDEFPLGDKLTLNVGIRHDRYPSFGGTTNPRLALIYNPMKGTALKFLYGNAFRAPNLYELYYESNEGRANPDLRPETIQTGEAVLEQYVGRHLRLSASLFTFRLDDLIVQRQAEEDSLRRFVNAGDVRSRGAEVEAEGKWNGGWQGRVSYSYQNSVDRETGGRLPNSPAHVGKVNLTAPLLPGRLFASLNAQHVSARETPGGGTTPAYTLANLNLVTRDWTKAFDLSFGIYNLFNRAYADPGGEEHRQSLIYQNGRTFRAKLTYRLRREE